MVQSVKVSAERQRFERRPLRVTLYLLNRLPWPVSNFSLIPLFLCFFSYSVYFLSQQMEI